MEVRDPVHGSIHILDEESKIIKNPFFQRLRGIKQLGFSEYVFPGATHSRFLHSIGVMEIGSRTFNKLFPKDSHRSEFQRLKETFKLACLLHDIGHAPLSHSTESVMPLLKELKLPEAFTKNDQLSRQATHEDYTIKAIVDSDLRDSFKEVRKSFGVEAQMVASLIQGHNLDPSYFSLGGINYFPLLHQLVSSEMDCDRMDYLLRDSYFCGVSYGNYDLDWLLDNLQVCYQDQEASLGITERAIITFDDFLLSRYHMFVMVYFHYRSVCLEQLLMRYFAGTQCEYSIPVKIEDYLNHDDKFLINKLKLSNDENAQAVVNNKIPQKVYESFNDQQLNHLKKIQQYLEDNHIDFIRCSSSGRLSKYYQASDEPIKYSLKVVRSHKFLSQPIYFDIGEATDLFSKFSKSHAINRLHIDWEKLSLPQKDEITKQIKSIIKNG